MIVKSNRNLGGCFTKGKLYNVIETNPTKYLLLTDSDFAWWVSKRHFEELNKYDLRYLLFNLTMRGLLIVILKTSTTEELEKSYDEIKRKMEGKTQNSVNYFLDLYCLESIKYTVTKSLTSLNKLRK